MSIASEIRNMYDKGLITDSPEDKKLVAKKFNIAVQTVHATLKKHLEKRGVVKTIVVKGTVTNRPQVVTVSDMVDVKKAVMEKYDECYKIASAKGYDLPKIDVRFDIRGTVAGQFCVHYGTMFFRVNMILAKENLEDYINQTVPHEFCHYIVWKSIDRMYGRPQPHGYEWKQAMIRVFGLEPQRCHSYDTTNARTRKVPRPYVYKCKCRERKETAHIHNIIKGCKYRCGDCGEWIVFVGVE